MMTYIANESEMMTYKTLILDYKKEFYDWTVLLYELNGKRYTRDVSTIRPIENSSYVVLYGSNFILDSLDPIDFEGKSGTDVWMKLK